MAKRIRRRRCWNCQDLFHPDYRNRNKQHYCSKSPCRSASKKASNDRWRMKKENRDYFSGPTQVARVQEWRKANPGYGKKKHESTKPLQDHLIEKTTQKHEDSAQLAVSPLQDLLTAKSPILLGLIANLTGNTLQDDIARTITGMAQLGQDILNCSNQPTGGRYDPKISNRPSTNSQGSTKI